MKKPKKKLITKFTDILEKEVPEEILNRVNFHVLDGSKFSVSDEKPNVYYIPGKSFFEYPPEQSSEDIKTILDKDPHYAYFIVNSCLHRYLYGIALPEHKDKFVCVYPSVYPYSVDLIEKKEKKKTIDIICTEKLYACLGPLAAVAKSTCALDKSIRFHTLASSKKDEEATKEFREALAQNEVLSKKIKHHGVYTDARFKNLMEMGDIWLFPTMAEEETMTHYAHAMSSAQYVVVPDVMEKKEVTASFMFGYMWEADINNHARNLFITLKSVIDIMHRDKKKIPNIIRYQKMWIDGLHGWETKKGSWVSIFANLANAYEAEKEETITLK